MKRLTRILAVLFVLCALLIPTRPAQADVAPPETPPGSSLAPGAESTQVRMMAETVTLDIISDVPAGSLGQAAVTANFTMRNMGEQAESMAARFPLTFWNGRSDGFFNFPEVRNLKVWVDGQAVSTQRIEVPGTDNEERLVPWAAFDVTFPPGEDVQIKVTYLADAYGEYPFAAYRYILETGAGWQGTIGSARLIVRLPYDATPQNVLLDDESTGFSRTSPGAVLEGREVRWEYTDLEPTAADNLEVSLVMVSAWRKVLRERSLVSQNNRDGEAWGRLGKACKEAIEYRRGLRQDLGGKILYEEAVQAYQESLRLLPNDSLWHTGYADLLWQHYFWDVSWQNPDFSLLEEAVSHLKTALELDVTNTLARELLDWISVSMEAVVEPQPDGSYEYLILTATPVYTPWPTLPPPATLTPTPPLETPTQAPEPTEPPTAAPTAVPAAETPAGEAATQAAPTALPTETTGRAPGLPICGGAAAVLTPLLGVAMQRFARRRG